MHLFVFHVFDISVFPLILWMLEHTWLIRLFVCNIIAQIENNSAVLLFVVYVLLLFACFSQKQIRFSEIAYHSSYGILIKCRTKVFYMLLDSSFLQW
jgi:hypothetical protein